MPRAVLDARRRALRRARRGALLRRGLPRARARPRRPAPGCVRPLRARGVARERLEDVRAPGPPHGLDRVPRRRAARRDRGGQALHDDLLERPERAAVRDRAPQPGAARRAEPAARPREPRARRRVRRGARRRRRLGPAERLARSASRASASRTRRRSASSSPPRLVCCCCRARCTTSRGTSGSASAGSARPRRSRGCPSSSRARTLPEVLLDEPEQHAVDPLAVAPVRLPADALTHPARPAPRGAERAR